MSKEEASGVTSDGPGAIGVVLIAASAGGIEATQEVLRGLPRGLGAAVVVVQHRTPRLPSMLPSILARSTALRTKPAEEGERLHAGVLYVAPADRHLEITASHTLHLANGPRIRHVLSSANPLFESAAVAYGPNVLAMVLTGADSDGTDGVQTVAAHGGTVLAQDPSRARFPSMPRAAIRSGAVRRVLGLEEMPSVIVETVRRWQDEAREAPGAQAGVQ